METRALYQLNRVSNSLVRTPGNPGDLKSVLQHIAEIAANAFSPDICVIRAINPITAKFLSSPVAVGDLRIAGDTLHEDPRPEGITQLALRDGEVFIEDFEDEDRRGYHNRFTREEGIQAIAGLPLRTRHRKRPLGVIYLNFRQPREFSAIERESYQLFATLSSLLLQEAWLARNYLEVARIGQEVNQNLSTVEKLFDVLQTYVDTVLDESHTLLLAVYQPQTNRLDVHTRKQQQSHSFSMPLQGASEHVFETKESLFIEHYSKEARRLPFQVTNITGNEEQQSFIFVPLLLRDEFLGVLSIQHPSPKAYGQEDLFVLQLLANYIALALHNMRLYNSLTQLNETGQLLTRHLEPDQTLQATADKIRQATQADVVVLYPHKLTGQRFVLPPLISGELYASSREYLSTHRPGEIASLALHHELPIFAKQGITLYTALTGHMRISRDNFQQREQIRSTAMIPLTVDDEQVGVLFVNFRQSQRFDSTQKLFIEGLAHFAAIAIRNAQTMGMLSHRRERELQILARINRELYRSLDLESVLNTLLNFANEQIRADAACILLYNPQTGALEPAAAIGQFSEIRQELSEYLRESQGITRWALEQRRPVRVGNVHDPRWRDIYIQAAADTRSELDMPLYDGEEKVGVLNFESVRANAFRQEDEDFLKTLAEHAVLAIKKAQAYDREKRLAEERQLLNEISKEITSQFDHIRVFALILKKTLELTRSTVGALLLYAPESNDLQIAAQQGLDKVHRRKRFRLDEGIVGLVATEKQPLNIGDVSQPPWKKIYQELFPRTSSELAVPMLAGNELLGVINVESTSPHHFTKSDERLLQGLADLAVVALQNANLYDQARMEAERFELLYQAGQELSKISNERQLDQAYDIILDYAEKQSECQVVIRRYDEATQELELIRASQPLHPRLLEWIPLDEGVNGQVAREKRTVVVDDTEHPPAGVVPPKLADPTTRSLVVTPIKLENHYYGNLGLRHEEVGHFRGANIKFVEGLAQQLASTIYRVEVVQALLDVEQRALAAEEMSLIGEDAFGLTHRLVVDLGPYRSYIADIRDELKRRRINKDSISTNLDQIEAGVQKVLDMREALQEKLTKSHEALDDERVVIAPADILKDATQTMDPSLLTGVTLMIDSEDEVAQVRVYPRSVVEILRDLVINAIQAMPQGGTITLKARDIGRYVALDVSDTGIGVPLESQTKIFNLFYSTEGGFGFGLWSAHNNAVRNRGDLKVLESRPGRGTTFRLSLPKADVEDSVTI